MQHLNYVRKRDQIIPKQDISYILNKQLTVKYFCQYKSVWLIKQVICYIISKLR